MAPLPKRKYAKARKGERRSHLGVVPPVVGRCPQCNSPKLFHHVCLNCGTYAGKEVLEIKSSEKKSS